jgi:hypothetical protein
LDPTTAAALDRLAARLAAAREQRATLWRTRPDDPAIAGLDRDVQLLEQQFGSLAAQRNLDQATAAAGAPFDLRQEFEQLIRPLLRVLNDATAVPRRVTDMKARVLQLQQLQADAEQALRVVERTRDSLPVGAPARAEAERELAVRWRPAISQLRDEALVLQANLVRVDADATSLVAVLAGKAQEFVRTSGLNVLLATLVFLVVYFGLRGVVDRLLRKRQQDRGFSLRLLEVVLRVGTAVLAVVTMLIVPWARNDWLLLAVGIVFLVGAGWVVMRTLPQFLEQARLLLNVGGVREGERMLVDGLPFRIEALRFYPRLCNPELQGGVLRVPLQFLVGKRSRPCGNDEPWFPTRVGDVVLLADGSSGPVRTQTPDVVVIEAWGSPRSYPTAEFLRLSPRNLSRGFVVDALLPLGREVSQQTAQVVTVLQQELLQRLRPLCGDALLEVEVSVQAITPAGLELLATARCLGGAAGAYFRLRRTMQQVLLDCCSRHGWPLPAVPLAPPAAQAR